ncbi:MAG: alpha/beta hydrolase [Pseudomonadota bacterium]
MRAILASWIVAALPLSAHALDVDVEGETAFLNGVIDGRSLGTLQRALKRNPGVEVLYFEDMPGSADDEANLEMARWVRAQGLTTELGANSIIESGAVDLFLAGVDRHGACGAQVGVHSWADSSGYTAAELARNHPDHAPYLSYYAAMGIPGAFYWFTVAAAPAEGMYYMTPAEINQFAVVTDPLTCS